MLSQEWRELVLLNLRLARLKERYVAAVKRDGTGDGLTENLRRELMSLQDQHDELVAYISQHIGEILGETALVSGRTGAS